MLKMLSKYHSDAELNEFMTKCKKVAKQGILRAPSLYVTGVVDLAYPIMDGDMAVASLTVPYIERIPAEKSIEEVIESLKAAADELSKALTYGIVRKS
ncbi:hypothetical protein RS130_15425 [Paraglaciecola aquimarina]|uniref:IclR-ED domain-containing protein n=1 Tax=Paraglaciecola aquimarina TaxID=1235557 RepID=A0ABU3SYL4_9ALTE|nr:hypothetical protein [Paraglaciecola aquimarina]MDU0355105.1 hypothetical protein [Paraglaciecola aquimarina]